MARKLAVLPQAVLDIDDASSFIDQFDETRALRLLDAAADTFNDLLAMPGMGSLYDVGHPDLPDVRRWTIKGFPKYLVFYRVTEESVTILRVLHGARDIQAAFSDYDWPDEE